MREITLIIKAVIGLLLQMHIPQALFLLQLMVYPGLTMSMALILNLP